MAENTLLPEQSRNKTHLVWIDLLRTLAIFAVLLQHTSDYYIDGQYAANTASNIGAYILNNISRFHVPTFIMITGTLLLGRTVSVKAAWTKYIRRIAIAFCVWSALYTVYNTVFRVGSMGMVAIVKNAIVDFASGGTRRMWYLFVLLGLYMITPIVSKFISTSTQKEREYVLMILLVMVSVIPTLMMIPAVETVLGTNMQRIASCFPGVYVLYFIAGYYLSNESRIKLGMGKSFLIILLSLASLAVFFGYGQQKAELLMFPVVSLSVVVFLLAQGFTGKSEKFTRLVKSIADCTFGIYLVHTFFQYLMQLAGLEKMLFSMPAIIGILLYSVVLFLLSWGFTALLRLTKWGRLIT